MHGIEMPLKSESVTDGWFDERELCVFFNILRRIEIFVFYPRLEFLGFQTHRPSTSAKFKVRSFQRVRI